MAGSRCVIIGFGAIGLAGVLKGVVIVPEGGARKVKPKPRPEVQLGISDVGVVWPRTLLIPGIPPKLACCCC